MTDVEKKKTRVSVGRTNGQWATVEDTLEEKANQARIALIRPQPQANLVLASGLEVEVDRLGLYEKIKGIGLRT